MNLVAKVHFFYAHYGLWRTMLRVLERITGLNFVPLPSRSQGLATMIVGSSERPSTASRINLTPGMAATQDLGAVFDELFELELRIERGAGFAGGEVALYGEKGQIFGAPLDERASSGSRYSISFDKPLAVSDAGALRLVVSNTGGAGVLTLPIADPVDCQLPAASHRGEEQSGPLAVRIAGRSSSQYANYWRPPVPHVWSRKSIGIGALYAAGFAEMRRFPQATVERLRADPQAPGLSHVLVLGRDIEAPRARELVAQAQRRYIPVVGVVRAAAGPQHETKLTEEQLAQWSDLLLPTTHKLAAVVEEWLPRYRARVLPCFSIVTILYNKAPALRAVLHSYFKQDYAGEFEVVLVDDASPDDSVALVERIFAEARQSGHYARLPPYRLIRNSSNRGNCVSRNIGIGAAQGDVLVIIDADCMLNRSFLSRHAQAHSFGDTDAVIGPFNIETGGEEPLACLARMEAQPRIAASRTQLQDDLNRLSFLNCITRNFSIRREALEPEPFDPAFAYSADPGSGFGWEDVEMGYRLYRRGKRIKYVSGAFSVHISHEPAVPDRHKPVRSARNLRRLFDKHPELPREARHWARQTVRNLVDWFARMELGPSEDLTRLQMALASGAAERPQKRVRKLRVLTYRWHVPHQYELYKLGQDFSLVRDAGGAITGSWELAQRPMPDNARFISKQSVEDRNFDLAILHFDENVLSWENTNGMLGPDWGAAFRWFMENIRLPKVAVCHGTPQFYGQYNPNYDKPDLLQVIEPARRKLVEYLGDTLVICNSHQAQREWGFRRSRVIWHGFDPTEFAPATYERGILSPTGPLVSTRPHYRGYFLYQKVFADFPPEFLPSALSVPDPSPLYHGNQFATWKYRNYVDQIRRYSIYFNPTQRSPMPRARGEPMMCGVVTVSAKNHDVDLFIRNGVNGFYAEEARELREQLLYLSRNPEATRKIGAAGRRTALDLFNIDRYLGDWRDVIRSLA